MSECYNIEISDGKLVFGKRELGVPGCVIQGKLPEARDGLDAVCRMGDPDLLQCLVYRRENAPGGILPCGTNMACCLRLLPKARLFTPWRWAILAK